MRITALAGGVGGARFLRGLLAHLGQLDAAGAPTGAPPDHEITVIGNTGDDITLFGLRMCPDIDTILYTLGGGAHEQQGWGRADETFTVATELAELGAQPDWFTLGDKDFATHIRRSQLLGQGLPLSEVTRQLAQRWGLAGLGVRLLPMSDTPVETHVIVEGTEVGRAPGPVALHFQEWWVRHRAAVPAQRFVVAGMEAAGPAPGVLEAIREADVVLLPPSNPVVSIGIILGVPGVRDALRGTRAPVVGVSPLIDGRPVRGHADACLAALGLPSTSQAVAGLYADFLTGWVVDPADSMAHSVADSVAHAASDSVADSTAGPARRSPVLLVRPTLMTDVPAAAEVAGAALAHATALAAQAR